MSIKVKVWEEKIVLPTYQAAEPDKNPLFFENRVYQGSSGKVYPLPVTEKIADEKVDVTYQAVFLENEYLKVMILPELGGRIQRAYDKTNDYDFVYYNHVIKPALVGLVGPWISGGVEFNWPQHHRPSTFMPTEYRIVENQDGSKTVFVSEIDQMYGTKGMAAFTLHPDKAYIEINGKLFNRTDTAQTFLWWANPAVPVNDHTFSVFPPDVHAVMDHGKRAVSSFPIATGTYYKYDYSEGIDISRYENIEVPTSYMAYHSDYDFIGNYDEEKKAGLLHVADHHISPGKKQWTWGNSDFGQAWDRNLTDEDGPYIELMTGVYTDNQPDFTWLRPYEEKTFTQYFMPYKGVGRVKNASKQAALNIELIEGKTVITVYATEVLQQVQLSLSIKDEIVFSEILDLSPKNYFEKELLLDINAIDEDVKLVLSDNESIIVAYAGVTPKPVELPEPATELGTPSELKNTEELFLAATHIEQYRHATLNAEDYYLEGLRRDNEDIRLNNGYGMFLYRQARFTESEEFFRTAVKRQTWKTPNPYYGEPIFNLALAQLMQGKTSEAYDNFYKAVWNEDTQGAAYFQLACLEAKKQHDSQALEFVEKSLVKNQHNMKARLLRINLLRKLGRDVSSELEANLEIDPLDLGTWYELSHTGNLSDWQKVMRSSVNNYLELASDYLKFGDYGSAKEILNQSPRNPLMYYYLAYIELELGDEQSAKKMIKEAEATDPSYCFPNKLLDALVLRTVIDYLPESTFYANYYLGNLYYDKKRYEEAIVCWEQAVQGLANFPTVYRNLAFAYFNQFDDLEKALRLQEKAVELDPNDARLLLELDLLLAKTGSALNERIGLLEERLVVVTQRDDLFVEYITLLNCVGRYHEAYKLINERQFHPWEGGEGKVSNQYVTSLVNLAIQELESNPEKAIELLLQAIERPHNLGEGKLPNYHDNWSHYLLGQAYEKINDRESMLKHYRLATKGTDQPENVMYYNDQPADLIFYKGLAHLKLNEEKEAKTCFHKLLAYGEKHLFDDVKYDYFAVSLPETVVFKDNLLKRNSTYCRYLMAMGEVGLGKREKALEILRPLLQEVPDHQGALQLVNYCQSNKF